MAGEKVEGWGKGEGKRLPEFTLRQQRGGQKEFTALGRFGRERLEGAETPKD